MAGAGGIAARQAALVAVLASALGAQDPARHGGGGLADLAQVHQDPDAQRLHRLQAAFVRRILTYTRWPDEALRDRSEFVVAVVGDEAMAEALAEAQGKEKLVGRAVVFRRHAPDEPDLADRLADCHVVWWADRDRRRRAAAIVQLARSPVLQISDEPAFLADGGTVQLFEQDNKLRFGIAREAAQRAGLEFSSQLLALARPVPAPQPRPVQRGGEPKPAQPAPGGGGGDRP